MAVATKSSSAASPAPLRVLVLISGAGGTRMTGPEIRGWALARALAEQFEVTVALHEPPAKSRDGLRLIPYTRRTLVREARRHDAVLAPVIPPYLFAALRGTSTVTIADQYDPVTLELSVFTEHPGIDRLLKTQKSIRETQLRFADVIVCAGERQKELLLEELDALGPRRTAGPPIVSLPFGLPEAPQRNARHPIREHFHEIGQHDPVVLWWGKIWKWFDAKTAIEAFALVAERRPDARLVISAGKAPKARFDNSERTDDARELSRSLGVLDRNVFFLDEWTPYDRRHEYLDDADIGLTLHADTPEAPFAARARYLDYLWCSLPCVLAHGDEVADRFGAAGFAELVAPGDTEGAARAILRLIDDPQRLEAARVAGQALAEDYRWSVLVRPLAEAIRRRAADREPSASDRLMREVGGYYVRRAVDHAAALVRSASR